jgi:hypothetical protein
LIGYNIATNLYVTHAVNAKSVPPHSVSLIAVFHEYFVNRATFVMSNTPYKNIPNTNASRGLLFCNIIK